MSNKPPPIHPKLHIHNLVKDLDKIGKTYFLFQKAHLGICDLTITSERNAVVDFSIPFMSLGISLLFREEDPEAPNKFSFIKPLSLDVWLYLATTYVVVSFILLICARLVGFSSSGSYKMYCVFCYYF